MLTNSENEVTQEVREEHYVSLPPENIQFDTFLVLDEMHMILLFCPGDNQPDALFLSTATDCCQYTLVTNHTPWCSFILVSLSLSFERFHVWKPILRMMMMPC